MEFMPQYYLAFGDRSAVQFEKILVVVILNLKINSNAGGHLRARHKDHKGTRR